MVRILKEKNKQFREKYLLVKGICFAKHHLNNFQYINYFLGGQQVLTTIYNK